MSPQREEEFEQLLAFVSFYMTHVKAVDPASPINLANVVSQIAEKYGRSKALEGLRQAANDLLEDFSHVSVDGVVALDEALRSQGIVTLSALRRRYASSLKRVLRRGAIQTETEYYMINAIVIDLASGVEHVERSELQRLLDAYEAVPNPPFQRTATRPLN